MVRDGYFYGLALIVVAVIVYLLTDGTAWALLPLLLAAFFLWFFRDPKREIPNGAGLIVSPGDGKVTRIDRITTPAGENLHISIFLSVFNVHVNRAPVSGMLREVSYQKGQFLNALNPASAEKNEQNLAVIECEEGYRVAFKQIAGLLARRIVFTPKFGDRLERGQRVGLIKFGSRVDVMLPATATMRVKVGDTVKGGATILAELGNAAPEPESERQMEILA